MGAVELQYRNGACYNGLWGLPYRLGSSYSYDGRQCLIVGYADGCGPAAARPWPLLLADFGRVLPLLAIIYIYALIFR